MDNVIPLPKFDRGKPFYPLVLNYLILCRGFVDHIVKGHLKRVVGEYVAEGYPGLKAWDLSDLIYLQTYAVMSEIIGPVPMRKPPDVQAIEAAVARLPDRELVVQNIARIQTQLSDVHRLTSELTMLCRSRGGHVLHYDSELIHEEVSGSVAELLPFLLRSAGGLLIVAYEATKAYGNKEPLWEFFRHARNAAGHNGHWRFLNGEPKRSAAWGPFRLTSSMDGSLLFHSDHEPGTFSLGDPILLLWDIEQATPSISA
jgi:hypothetical protein